MFQECMALKKINFNNFNAKNVICHRMFYNGFSLEELDLGNFNVDNATSMVSMLVGCQEKLKIEMIIRYNIKKEAFEDIPNNN